MTTVHKDLQVKALTDLFDGLIGSSRVEQPLQQYLEKLAKRLLDGHKNKHSGILFIVGQKLKTDDLNDVFALRFTIDDAKLCIAKEHGFENWQAVENYNTDIDPVFEPLVDKMLAGDIDAIKNAIQINPDIVHQQSSYPHRATLLHYTGSNGVEGYRQVIPANLADIVETLLASGADQGLNANIYGGCTAQALLETSKHPYEAGVMEGVLAVYNKFTIKG